MNLVQAKKMLAYKRAHVDGVDLRMSQCGAPAMQLGSA